MFVSSIDEIEQLINLNREKLIGMGIAKLGVFGSFASGKAENSSDIDFLIEFQKDKKTYDNFLEISDFLEELFYRKIELITPESLKSFMRNKILAETYYVI